MEEKGNRVVRAGSEGQQQGLVMSDSATGRRVLHCGDLTVMATEWM